MNETLQAPVSDLVIAPSPKAIPREITETEKAKRALQKRYKAIFGYKPVGLTLEALGALVRKVERANGIVPVEEVPAQVDEIQNFAERFKKR